MRFLILIQVGSANIKTLNIKNRFSLLKSAQEPKIGAGRFKILPS